MKADLHIHTAFSCDSEADVEQYIKQAIATEVEWICFTDHIDWNKEDFGYDCYKPEKFFEKFNALKKTYNEQLKICAGIEFAEPHLYADRLEQLSKYPYDYIIGSIHWIGDMFPCQKVREKYSAKEFYTMYWEEVLSTVKQGGFDCLGHIDFPKRYYGEIYYQDSKMKEIFKYLLDKDMVIEINTSSLRKGHSETMPGGELLEIYKACGGKYVTIGSDAHEIKDLAADNHVAKKLIEELSLQEVVYENRKRVVI